MVWYYPKGVANILSQYRMAACSKWNINYSTDRFHKTGNPKDLSYHCTTQEGIKCLFVPNPQGLHVLDASDNFLLVIQIPDMFLEKEYLITVLTMELQCGQNATLEKDLLK